jgi:hypothetical protein
VGCVGQLLRIHAGCEIISHGSFPLFSKRCSLDSVAKKFKGAQFGGPNTALLLRVGQPREASSSPSSSATSALSLLGEFPPKMGKGRKKLPLTGARLLAWVESTLTRFSAELAGDAKRARDRAIVAEIDQGLAAGLAADLERERAEAAALEEAARSQAAAAAAKEAEQAFKAAEGRRRAALKAALGPEPPLVKAARGKHSGARSEKLSGAQTATDKVEPVVTIGVRLPDGSRLKRRFYSNVHTFGSVFDWLDCDHGFAPGTLRLRSAAREQYEAESCLPFHHTPIECSDRADPMTGQALSSFWFVDQGVLLVAELL